MMLEQGHCCAIVNVNPTPRTRVRVVEKRVEVPVPVYPPAQPAPVVKVKVIVPPMQWPTEMGLRVSHYSPAVALMLPFCVILVCCAAIGALGRWHAAGRTASAYREAMQRANDRR